MNHRKILGGVVALLLAATTAQPLSAQRPGSWLWTVEYSTVLGAGDTSDYAGGFSWRGMTVDGGRMINENLAIGFNTGWHVLDEKNSGTDLFDQGAVTGTAYRYVNSIPILLTGKYYGGANGAGTRPFLGVGAGTYWIENRTETGVYAFEDTNWHFGLMGEAGVAIMRPGGMGATLSVRYNWGLKTNDVERQYWTFSLGYVLGT
jgi:outer membrane protein W